MQLKLLAPDCNIITLLTALQGKDRVTAIVDSRAELHALDMLRRTNDFYKRQDEADRYDKAIGAWLWYIERNDRNARPDFITNLMWELFQSTEKTFPAQAPTDTEA